MNRSSAPCDLHIHSLYSDGVLTPLEIVKRAKEAGLAALSVTDHDTIASQAEALAAGRDSDIDVIAGVEFTVMEGDAEIHILGYLFDPDDKGMIERCRSRESSRHSRAEKILEKLSLLGIDLDVSEIERISGEGTIGRLHIARALREHGHAGSIQDAFNRYIGNGRPAFVPRTILKVEEAISVIRGAGGVAVWAHPGQAIRRKALVSKMIAAGISGLESNHPNHTPDLSSLVKKVALSHDLICTGGSDFHFTEVMKADIGGVTVSYDTVRRLRERAGDI